MPVLACVQTWSTTSWQRLQTRDLTPLLPICTATRVGRSHLGQTNMTFECAMGADISTRPVCICCGVRPRPARRCLTIIFTPSTSTRPVSGETWITRPRLPGRFPWGPSSPETTSTWSPFLILTLLMLTRHLPRCTYWGRACSNNLRSQRNDFHVFLLPQLPGHGAKNPGAGRVVLCINYHCCIFVKSDIGTVRPLQA